MKDSHAASPLKRAPHATSTLACEAHTSRPVPASLRFAAVCSDRIAIGGRSEVRHILRVDVRQLRAGGIDTHAKDELLSVREVRIRVAAGSWEQEAKGEHTVRMGPAA